MINDTIEKNTKIPVMFSLSVWFSLNVVAWVLLNSILEDKMSVNVTFFSLVGYFESMWGGFRSFPSIFSGRVGDIIKPNTRTFRVLKVTLKLFLFFHGLLFLVGLSPILNKLYAWFEFLASQFTYPLRLIFFCSYEACYS